MDPCSPCSENCAVGANRSPVTGNLQAKPCSHAFVSSQSASSWWLPRAFGEDRCRRSHESGCITCERAGRQFCKVSGSVAAVGFSPQSAVKTCLYSAALPVPSESFDAVISDIPFGKKFKITKDIQLLLDILQGMERTVWPLTGLGFGLRS